MPWAAPLWGSALGSGVSRASRGNLHTLHRDTGGCPACRMAMAPALSRTPVARMCHETFLYKWLLIKSLAASRYPLAPCVLVPFLSDPETWLQ